MFSLLVLFTVFLGLVGVLLFSDHCRRKSREGGSHRVNAARLVAWLEERGHTLPSPETVVDLVNSVAKRTLQSEDWESLEVTDLLPETELPHISVSKILQQTPQHIEFQVYVEWPMCLPGVGVRLKRKEEEEVMCELQVDWMYAEATVRFTGSSDGLLLSYRHSRTPQMALSCLVTTEGIKEPECLASSVAHSLQLMFYEMELTTEPLTTEPLTTEPLTRDPLSKGEEGEGEGEGAIDAHQNSTIQNNHVFKTTPTLTVSNNHTNHTPHHSAHQDKPHPPPDKPHPPTDTPHPPSETAPLNLDLNTATSDVREGEGEREGEREGEGEGEAVPNGPTTYVPVSRKLWQRECVDAANAEGEGEQGREENGDVGETGEGVRVGEGEGEVVETRENTGTAEEPEKTPVSEERVEETQEAAAVTETERTPVNLPLLQIRDSNKTPPTGPSQNSPEHPSPLTTHTHSSPSITTGSLSKSVSSWRRSPSYEKLQEFTLPSVWEGGVVSEQEEERSPAHWRRQSQSVRVGIWGGRGEREVLSPMSLDRRKRQALSMSGSAYSVESGEAEVYPSTLVFEISDSHRTRHIVALSQAHASKLRKRVSHARKLHIYNDHIFIATHLRQRFYCHVCKKKIMGFMGKQGYMCRDCNMVVHKHCHCKTEGQCSSSKLSTMNLIYPDSVSTISGL